jgi:hypothetical protein
MLTKSDIKSLERCVPCIDCKVKPVWGSAFLVCPKCGKESPTNYTKGNAVRNWNRMNKKNKEGFILGFCEKCYQMTNHNTKGKCMKCKGERKDTIGEEKK